VDPRLIFQEGVRVYSLGDLVVVDIIVHCLFNYPAFLDCRDVIEALFVDSLRLNEVEKMLFGDHFDLRQIRRLTGVGL
jgi:hypothetical protein